MKIHFKKQFGQNFLINSKYIMNLVDSLHLEDNDTVLEIGPGHGAVTEILLNRCRKVMTVEIDDDFVEYLNNRFRSYVLNQRLQIIHKDILYLNIPEIIRDKNYKAVGSLPYNISKKIIRNFIESNKRPLIMSFIVQKEVALDYTAIPPKATFLSNFIKIFCRAKFIKVVPKECFKPEPKVDGAIIYFEARKYIMKDYDKFIRFLKSSFLNPRKMLVNNLSAIYRIEKEELRKFLEKIDINQNIRASELEFNRWISLYNYINREKQTFQ